MDWYAWLCRAGLHPDVAFEYALLFARNGLAAADDLRHLDHHALASIGVPVAKHRIHILTLAKREKSPLSSSSVAAVRLPWRATRLLAAAALSLADRLRSLARRDKASVAVAPLWKKPPRPSPPSSTGRRGGNKKMALLMRQLSKPMATNYSGGGGKRMTRKTAMGAAAAAYKGAAPTAKAAAITGCFANHDAYGYSDDEEDDAYDDGEDMRWESMFQDLNPT